MCSNVTIEMFPAGNGDAILIDAKGTLILIDGGYVSTYRNHLKPRLKKLASEGRILDLLVVTHIDADHISGIIAFLEDNGDNTQPQIIKVKEIWHNSYRHLKFPDVQEHKANGARPKLNLAGGSISRNAEDGDEFVSYPQGTTLASLILRNGYEWNKSFDNKAVAINHVIEVSLSLDVTLTVIGPTFNDLDKMSHKWYTYLSKRFPSRVDKGLFFDDAFELMMEEDRQAKLDEMVIEQETFVANYSNWVESKATDWMNEDRSETNGASIIFLLEVNDCKMLFLGDAIPQQVIETLFKLNVSEENPLKVDVLKVAHHGAWSNNSPELLGMVQAKKYLFSSNGKRHHHPHFETIAWLLKKHSIEKEKTLIFNYSQRKRNLDLESDQIMKKYNYKVEQPDVDEFGRGEDGYIKVKV